MRYLSIFATLGLWLCGAVWLGWILVGATIGAFYAPEGGGWGRDLRLVLSSTVLIAGPVLILLGLRIYARRRMAERR